MKPLLHPPPTRPPHPATVVQPQTEHRAKAVRAGTPPSARHQLRLHLGAVSGVAEPSPAVLVDVGARQLGVAQPLTQKYREALTKRVNDAGYKPVADVTAVTKLGAVRQKFGPDIRLWVFENHKNKKEMWVWDQFYQCEGCKAWFPAEAMDIDHRVNWEDWAFPPHNTIRDGGDADNMQDLRLLCNDPENLTLRCARCNRQNYHNRDDVLWLRDEKRASRQKTM